MPTAYALHIGVDHVSPSHYRNLIPALDCCANDARLFHQLTESLQYKKSDLLTDADATTESVLAWLEKAAKELKEPGSLCVITYSGHGGLLKDLNRDEQVDLPPGALAGSTDQTWCLFDRQLIDDELRYCWRAFDEGINIVLVIDSCHSGTAFLGDPLVDPNRRLPQVRSRVQQPKLVELADAPLLQKWHETEYEIIGRRPIVRIKEIKASLWAFTACQDNEVALAGFRHSQFTDLLKTMLIRESETLHSYDEWVKSAVEETRKVPFSGQTPNVTGVNPNPYFEQNAPFLLPGQTYPNNLEAVLSVRFDDEIPENDSKEGIDRFIVGVTDGTLRHDEVLAALTDTKIQPLTDNAKATDGENTLFLITTPTKKDGGKRWDQAYSYAQRLRNKGIEAFVEPDYQPQTVDIASKGPKPNDWLKNWSNPTEDLTRCDGYEFSWHLKDNFSQLEKARKFVEASHPNPSILIGHIDTGYRPEHPATPKRIKQAISLKDGEQNNPGIDLRNGMPGDIFNMERDSHGTATLALLAAGIIPEKFQFGDKKENGVFGAIPFAEVIVMRISDTVALFSLINNTRDFVRAMKHAIAQKCAVVTMSMGGAPRKSWAKVINQAYEQGIVVVSAAGNSFRTGVQAKLPKTVVFPARFDRVIAATGVGFDNKPYDFKARAQGLAQKSPGGEDMQGSWGPRECMNNAIAAFTPNIAWAFIEEEGDELYPVFLRNGGGTSSATPQVAAAAALWLIHNEALLQAEGYNEEKNRWKRVEAVRKALRESADKKTYDKYATYYGMGILKAYGALQVTKEKWIVSDDDKSPAAEVSWLAIREFLDLFKARPIEKTTNNTYVNIAELVDPDMVAMEIMEVLMNDPKLHPILETFSFKRIEELDEATFTQIMDAVQSSPLTSDFVKTLKKN